MSQQTYTPGVQNAPFGLSQANAQGSFYGAESSLSPAETNLLRKDIKRKLFDAAPKQFDSLKLVFSTTPVEHDSDEFEYVEYTFGRSPLTAASTASALTAAGTTIQTYTFDLDAASLDHVSVDLIITFPDNSEGVISNISGATITVGTRAGAGLPAVAIGDVFAIRSTIEGDGADSFSTYQRTETITRYNYVQFFLRAKRWDKIELTKWENTGTTNFLDVDKEQKKKQLRVDLFVSYFNGHRGEYALANSKIAKSMGGIYPSMVAAGSLSANPTVAGLQAAFEQLAFITNFKAESATRFIYGTQQNLNNFSKIYKQPGLRYTPDNEMANLNLTMIEFGGMKFVLVPCELFREQSCFPASWSKRLLVLDLDTIRPVKMKGIPAFDMGSTLSRGANGSRENYKDWWCSAQLSLEMNNPQASFSIDVQ
mgnify:CR=1 FL=1